MPDRVDYASTDEPIDPNTLPVVELAERDDREPRRQVHVWWFVVPTVLVAAVALTVGILVFNASAPPHDPGLRTAAGAAEQYVHAANAGDGTATAAASCPSFRDSARAAARSGREGLRFSVVRVTAHGGDTATAVIRVTLQVAGATQSQTVSVEVFRDNGEWLLCGLD